MNAADNPIHSATGTSSTQTSGRPGRVYLVGAGPGDPELLTLKAARLLGQARAVVFDHLVSDKVMALVNPAAQRHYAGKEAGNHSLPQDEINALLLKLAQGGIDVVRLKGGDPFIFGRGGEEMEALSACGVECEVVPGITAASGIAACTGIPLTHRNHARSVVFSTGHLKDDTVDLDWVSLARPNQTQASQSGACSARNAPVRDERQRSELRSTHDARRRCCQRRERRGDAGTRPAARRGRCVARVPWPATASRR